MTSVHAFDINLIYENLDSNIVAHESYTVEFITKKNEGF